MAFREHPRSIRRSLIKAPLQSDGEAREPKFMNSVNGKENR